MICIKNINISYNKTLFINQNIEIKKNCLTLIKGESGSGKTTLLYRIGLLDTRGIDKYIFADNEIPLTNQNQITKMRREVFGYVFQEYMLYDRLNVFENMQYFASMVGRNLTSEEAVQILQQVKLDIPLDRTLPTLSGGQKQRLAIACVLTKEPDVLILDEPSSALDKDNAHHIFQILKNISKNKTVIITSHNEDALKFCDEEIDIKDGIIKKVKKLEVKEKNTVNLNKNIKQITHISYMKKNDRYSSKQKRLIMFINVIVMISLMGIIHLINTGIEDSKSLISLDNKAQIYIEDKKDSSLEYLLNVEIYPIYKNQVMINGVELDVIPLFYKTAINNKLWTVYDTSAAEGFYFSYHGYKELLNKVVPERYIEFYDLSNMNNFEMVYKGILLNGVENEYTQSSKYILVDHKFIEEHFINSNRLGYTLFFEDYGEYSKTKGNLEKLGYNVEGLNGIEEIEEYIKFLTYLKFFSIALGALICGFGISFVYKNYIDSRKKEIALLQCNGIINNHIINMFYKEFISLNVFCFLTGLAIKCFIPGVSFVYMFIFEILILFVIYVLLHRIIKKINPIDILRDHE